MPYPNTLAQLQEELDFHAKEGRSDDLFRFIIMSDQIGDLAKHLSHDQKHNPVSRPYGTKESEINEAGHAIVQLMTYVSLRGINIQQAVDSALDGLRQKDFLKREAEDKSTCKGMVACLNFGAGKLPKDAPTKMFAGYAFVDPACENLRNMPMGAVLVTNHPGAHISMYVSKIGGIVTDNGGTMCHVAIICREFGIPCIVGTGNATSFIRNGEVIRMMDNGVVERCAP